MTRYIKEVRYSFWIVLAMCLVFWLVLLGCSSVPNEDTWCEGKPPVYGTDC